jgi:bifunctional DNA-binding transcriptional regulator/antitoxin component of YhaV-PrlF toxin-antitoxin module
MTILVDGQGSIRLPEEWLRKLGAGPGAQLLAEENDGGVLLRPMVPTDEKTLLQVFDEAIAKVPSAVLDKWPVDGAEEHDHYLYGTPKKREK